MNEKSKRNLTLGLVLTFTYSIVGSAINSSNLLDYDQRQLLVWFIYPGIVVQIMVFGVHGSGTSGVDSLVVIAVSAIFWSAVTFAVLRRRAAQR